MAQVVEPKLSKQLAKDYKPTMKMLKKKYDLSRVIAISYKDGFNYFLLCKKEKTENAVGIANKVGDLLIPIGNKNIFYKVENDGTRYFLIKNRFLQYGVSDLYGKTMIPVKYFDITYYPPLKKGVTVQTSTYGGETFESKYYHENCEGVFLAKYPEASCLVSSDGRILRDSIKGAIERCPGYWFVGEAKDNDRGLLSSNGETIVPREYRSIYILEKVCYYEKVVDGITYKGAIALDNSVPIVPCMFNTVFLSDDNNWFVKRRANDETEKYNPDKNYNTDFHDKGEELYERGKYDEVIEFYAKEGIDAPWAKFFTAVSMKNNAYSKHIYYMEGISDCIEKNISIPASYWESPIDTELSVKQFTLAKQMLEAYMQEDSTYYNQAESEHRMCDYYLGNMEQYKTRYKNALATLERRNAAEAARRREEAARQEARRQQNAAIVVGLLGGFTKALLGSGSSSSGNTYVAPATRNSSGGKVSSGSSSSSSLETAAPKKTTHKVQCKACGGTGLWVDEKPYGDEKYCDRCGKMRKPHTHKTCASCKGTGYHEK